MYTYIKQDLPSQDLRRANYQGLDFCSVDNCLPSNAWHTCHPALYLCQSPRRCRRLLQYQIAQQTPTSMLNKEFTGTNFNFVNKFQKKIYILILTFRNMVYKHIKLFAYWFKKMKPGHPATSNRREEWLCHDIGWIRKHRARIGLNVLLTIVSLSELPSYV